MITLYHCPRTRSSRIIWLLEEIGAPYTIAPVTIVRPMEGSGDPDAALAAFDATLGTTPIPTSGSRPWRTTARCWPSRSPSPSTCPTPSHRRAWRRPCAIPCAAII